MTSEGQLAAEYRCHGCGQLLTAAAGPGEEFRHAEPPCAFWASGRRAWDPSWPSRTLYPDPHMPVPGWGAAVRAPSPVPSVWMVVAGFVRAVFRGGGDGPGRR